MSTLGGVDLNPGKLGGFLGKTYSTGLYEVDGSLYHLCCYSVQKPGAWQFFSTSLYKSPDGGKTWLNHLGQRNRYIPQDIPSATFPDRRWGHVNFVKYGRGGEAPNVDNAGTFVYLACGHGQTYLARTRRADLKAWSGAFDRGRIEYYRGTGSADGMLEANWTKDIARCTAVRATGCPAAMVYHPGLRRYLTTAFLSDSWQKPPIPSTLILYEAPHPWGPWTEIHREFIEPRVGDNLTWLFLLQAFASPDGRKMWATVSGRAPYGLQFLPVHLTTEPVRGFEAESATRAGTEVATAVKGFSGKGYVTGFDQVGDACRFEVQAETAGLYFLRYRYHCAEDRQQVTLTLDGVSQGRLRLGRTEQKYMTWAEGSTQIRLPKGRHSLGFEVTRGDRAGNHLHLDRVQLALASR